jgi:hypothetical protein
MSGTISSIAPNMDMHLFLLLVSIIVSEPQVGPRVRSSHPYIRAMIAEAQVRSTTFRRIVTSIEATDGIVYVEEGDCRHSVRACLPPVITAGGGYRILRVLVDARHEDWEVMADIGHELQHALEVFTEPSVRTNSQVFLRFYQTNSGTEDRFETDAAVKAGHTVRNEVEAFARNSATKGQSR